MAILGISTSSPGQVGIVPQIIYIATNNTLAEVTATGFLNKIVAQGIALNEYDMALVSTKTTPSAAATQVAWLEISKSGDNWTLVPTGSPGSVVLPTTANHIAVYTNAVGELSEDATTAINAGHLQAGLAGTAGKLISFPATAANGMLVLEAINAGADFDTTIRNAASVGQDQVITIPDAGAATANFILSAATTTQTLSTGLSFVGGGTNIQITGGGNFLAGSSGAAGALYSYPATALNGSLGLVAVNNAGGDFDTVISNAASVGQDQVISIPDSGAATANFLLDTGAANIIAKQQFVGISEVLTFGTGTWTVTRGSQGNYYAEHSAADETSIIGVDITPAIRAAASKGFRLDSFDLIYGIATDPLDAHAVTLDRIEYANNVAVSVNTVAITGVLATATQANPYVTNVAVDTPAFDVTADSKYIIEVTANNSATSVYDYYGIMLHFSETVA